MPRHPAFPPPSPTSAPSSASRRSRFPGSTRAKCSAARRPSRHSSRASASSRPSRSAARRSPARTRRASRRCSPSAPHATAGRRSCSTRTTTCSRSATKSLWESAPFEPTVRGDRLYGRGAADDKAGVMAHVAALRALTEALGADFDLGVALFIEGEEEFGSRSFAHFLADNADALARRRHRRRRLRQLGRSTPRR